MNINKSFFKLTIFRLNAAVISIGIATRTENIPLDDTAIASGAPNFLKTMELQHILYEKRFQNPKRTRGLH